MRIAAPREFELMTEQPMKFSTVVNLVTIFAEEDHPLPLYVSKIILVHDQDVLAYVISQVRPQQLVADLMISTNMWIMCSLLVELFLHRDHIVIDFVLDVSLLRKVYG